MFVAVLIAGQVASGLPVSFDLRNLEAAIECDKGTDSQEIIVCAPSDSLERFRLRRLPAEQFEREEVRAETGIIGNLKAAAEVESQQIGPGVISKRVMIRLKLPF